MHGEYPKRSNPTPQIDYCSCLVPPFPPFFQEILNVHNHWYREATSNLPAVCVSNMYIGQSSKKDIDVRYLNKI